MTASRWAVLGFWFLVALFAGIALAYGEDALTFALKVFVAVQIVASFAVLSFIAWTGRW